MANAAAADGAVLRAAATSASGAGREAAQRMLLDDHLHHLRLPTFVKNHAKFAEDAGQANHSYTQFLLALAEHEIAQRDRNRESQRIKGARFPALKELADFDFSAVPQLNKTLVLQLARGEYLDAVESAILIGNPGLGKTHVSIGLALCACRQGHRVRFYNVASLVNDLIAAQDRHQTERFIASAAKHRLIVLDELGFVPLTPLGAQLIFQFCSTLHEKVSFIISTNLRFADWTQVFLSEQLTAALLDRLTFRAHILEFSGESFRFKQRMRRHDKAAAKAEAT
jgi:DNA replication protein DnaC